jgi:hypothetical protein
MADLQQVELMTVVLPFAEVELAELQASRAYWNASAVTTVLLIEFASRILVQIGSTHQSPSPPWLPWSRPHRSLHA